MNWLLGIFLLLSHFGMIYGSCTSSCDKDIVKDGGSLSNFEKSRHVNVAKKLDQIEHYCKSKVHGEQKVKHMKLKKEKNKDSEKKDNVVFFSYIVQCFSNAVLNYNNGHLEKSKAFIELAKKECDRIIENHGNDALDLYVYHHVSFREYKAKVDKFYVDKFDEGKKSNFSFFKFLTFFNENHE